MIFEIVAALCIFFIGIPIALSLLGIILELLWPIILVAIAASVVFALVAIPAPVNGTLPVSDMDVESVEDGIEKAKAMGTNRPVVFLDENGNRLGRCWRKSRGEYAC